MNYTLFGERLLCKAELIFCLRHVPRRQLQNYWDRDALLVDQPLSNYPRMFLLQKKFQSFWFLTYLQIPVAAMPPRLIPARQASSLRPTTTTYILSPRFYATISAIEPGTKAKTQPPSLKPAAFRKTQLLRQYASLLKATPLSLLFQHNNLSAPEWTGIRRELNAALAKVDAAEQALNPAAPSLAGAVKLQIVQTGIFGAALRIAEYYDPSALPEDTPKHVLSAAANEMVKGQIKTHAFAPLLAGPIALLTFPAVSPQHLKAALTVLAPRAPDFPKPTRKASPGWHDARVQSGLEKLMLLGARVEGEVFDGEGARWVGGIEGGLDGLRARVVHMLQSIGGGVTGALEAHGKSVYLALEGRRMQLDEEASPKAEEEGEKKDEASA